MTYLELSQSLKQLAQLIEKHADKLEGPALSKKAGTFSKQLTRFEAAIKNAALGFGPGIRELEKIFSSPDKKLLKVPEVNQLYQRVFGERAPSKGKATSASLTKDFLARVREEEAGEKALQETQLFLAKLKVLKAPIPKDKELLQKEMLRLGALSDEDLATELDQRFKGIKLKALANANGIKATKITREELIREVAQRARRLHGHIFL